MMASELEAFIRRLMLRWQRLLNGLALGDR